jgi:hypothetical protein
MDEFDLIRSFRRNDATPNPEARAAARDQLLAEIGDAEEAVDSSTRHNLCVRSDSMAGEIPDGQARLAAAVASGNLESRLDRHALLCPQPVVPRALWNQVRRLARSRVDAVGTAELAVKVAGHSLFWDDRPTPLSERFLRSPEDSGPEVLVLHLDDRAAVFAAAAKRVPSKRRVYRSEVRRLIVEFEFLDALTVDATELLSEKAVLCQDPAAWLIIEAIAEQEIDCVRIASESFGDTILVFRHAVGRVVVVRDEEIYAIDGRGVGRRNPSETQPFAAWAWHGLIAIAAAIVGGPLAHFLLEHVGVTIPVPAFVPVAVVVFAVLTCVRRNHR